MIHPADKGAKIPEHPLNLRGQSKLKLLVNVDPMRHWPPVIDLLVDAGSIRLETTAGLNMLEEKLRGVPLVHGGFREHLMGKAPCPYLFRHDERESPEVRLVHLDRSGKNGP